MSYGANYNKSSHPYLFCDTLAFLSTYKPQVWSRLSYFSLKQIFMIFSGWLLLSSVIHTFLKTFLALMNALSSSGLVAMRSESHVLVPLQDNLWWFFKLSSNSSLSELLKFCGLTPPPRNRDNEELQTSKLGKQWGASLPLTNGLVEGNSTRDNQFKCSVTVRI